jgi:YbbR domain-containing protein
MEINIWPNPASERLNIDVESDAALNYQIFNLSGEKILEGIIKSSVDISGLAAGIYIIHVAVNEESYFEKIIVSN